MSARRRTRCDGNHRAGRLGRTNRSPKGPVPASGSTRGCLVLRGVIDVNGVTRAYPLCNMSATPPGVACAAAGSAGIIGREGLAGRGADGRTGAASEPTQGRRAACRRGRRVRRDGLAGVRWGPFAGRRRWHVRHVAEPLLLVRRVAGRPGAPAAPAPATGWAARPLARIRSRPPGRSRPPPIRLKQGGTGWNGRTPM